MPVDYNYCNWNVCGIGCIGLSCPLALDCLFTACDRFDPNNYVLFYQSELYTLSQFQKTLYLIFLFYRPIYSGVYLGDITLLIFCTLSLFVN